MIDAPHIINGLAQFALILANVPVVDNHNRQINLHVGDYLRLECPIRGSNDPGGDNSHASYLNDDLMSDIIYQWNIQGLPEYALSMDTRFNFLEGGRIVELTQPVTKSDAGIYQCSGVTGFGQKKVVFEVNIADTNDDLLCVKAHPGAADRNQVLCLMNPNLRRNTIMTIDAELGSSVEMSCKAIGREPIKYLWFMGNAVADWISSSQGVRGPNLHIERVGREHIGQYVCQVKNAIGSLNYTYRLIGKEPLSAIPKIIEEVENQTMIAGSSGVLSCRVKCSCSEPIIQLNVLMSPEFPSEFMKTLSNLRSCFSTPLSALWLKRIDPEDVDTYRASGKSLVPLPTPRPEEASELYIALEKWEDAPAFMEQTVIEAIPAKSPGSPGNTPGEITVPEREFLSNTRHEGEAEGKIFLSRLRLRGPVRPQLHAGKYVVMTMSRSNLKAIDYAVAYVNIVPKSFNITVRNIIIYCVVPIVLILLTAFVSLYCFLSQRNKDLDHSANRRGGTLFSPVGRGHSLSGVKKEYQPIVRATPQSSVFSNGSKTYSCLPPYATTSFSTPNQWNSNPVMAASSTATSPITHSNSIHNVPSHMSQPANQLSPSASTFYNYSGLQSMLTQQPTYWHPPAPSIATETSFDQYSAIMGSSAPNMGGFTVNQ
ncbi:hypothetical protein ACTXT7_000460 [Hymenolepis weldensis]